ncbi:MAG: amidophosphoribosyltransferase, partial [Candidatus Nitrotoga sp.]
YFASAAPPVRFPNVYGIDMPSRTELIATGRTDDEICREIGADKLVYQDIDDLKAAIRMASPHANIKYFEASCFDGDYITGDITLEYLNILETARDGGKIKDGDEDMQLDLGLVVSADD